MVIAPSSCSWLRSGTLEWLPACRFSMSPGGRGGGCARHALPVLRCSDELTAYTLDLMLGLAVGIDFAVHLWAATRTEPAGRHAEGPERLPWRTARAVTP